MSTPRGIVDVQLRALLELVEAHREQQCEAQRERSRAESRRLIGDAWHEARTRLHAAVTEERQRGDERLTAAHAQLQTRARQQQYRVALGLLEAGWPRLREALLERWQAPVSRREWISSLLAQALEVLPPCAWRIEHPTGWSPEELAGDLARIGNHCQGAPQFIPRDDLTAGLRICAGAACLDGTLDGLLVDRTAIEARLLAEFNRRLGSDLLAPRESE